jgi:hypothetical protein
METRGYRRFVRFLFIFVVLSLFPQGDIFSTSDSEGMIISDALPVQFWLEGCDTYNESESYGVHPICWHQPWLCDDEIVIQFHDDGIGGNSESITLPALTSWLSRSTSGSLVNWTTGAAPNVTLPVAASEILYADYTFIVGREYTISITYTRVVNSGSSNPRTTTLSILDVDYEAVFNTTQIAATGSNTIEITFTATEDCAKIGIEHSSGSNVTITVNSTSGTVSTDTDYALRILNDDGDVIDTVPLTSRALSANGYIYQGSFIPLDYEICNQLIKLEIWSEASPEVRIAHSDKMDVRESHPDTKLITYTSTRNFAGLVYDDVSPTDTFYLRIRARFYHWRFPQKDEAMELTSSVLTTSSEKKRQKKLEVLHAPYYLHNKLIDVLRHHSVSIDNNRWEKEESYDVNEGESRWPLKTATTFLTLKNSVVRNSI